jgi:hypothetical protein
MGRDRGAALVVPLGAVPEGSLPSSQLLSGEISLAPAHPAALNAFVGAVSTPGSPDYRHFLGTGQFAARFGATPQTLQAVRSWLAGTGLHVTGTDPDDLFVRFSGTAIAVASAFGVSVKRYRFGAVHGFAAAGVPLVPASLVAQVRGIVGLSSLDVPRPQVETGNGPPSSGSTSSGGGPAAAPHISSVPTACSAAQSAASTGAGYTDTQVASVYGLDGLYNQGLFGAGVTVALFELEPFSASDISAFESCYGISTSVTPVLVNGGAGSGTGSGEAALDIEQVAALAPQSQILVYEGPGQTQTDVYDVYQQIADENRAQVVSTSWGLCEEALGLSWIQQQSALFQQMASQGQSVLAAAGDSGAEDCYTDAVPNSSQPLVDDPASQPDVTGVGATSMTSVSPRTEVVWNDCQDQPSTCAAAAGTGATGGGVSAAWAMPPWQRGSGVLSADSSGAPCGNSSGYCRQVPDLAATGDPRHGLPIYWNGGWLDVGGTSAAVVVWAAVAALLDEGVTGGGRLGLLNPTLYAAASCPNSYNDVTSGNNDFDANPDGLYPATAGYDMASGWGSPDATGLLGAFEAGGCGNGGPTNPSASALPTVAVQGPNQSLWVYWEAANAQWYGPLQVGGWGSTFSAPSVSMSPSGLPTVAVQGPNNALFVYWEASNAQWYGPLGVGTWGSTYGDPSLADSPSSGLPTIAVQGPNNALFVYWEASNAQWYGPLGAGTWGSTDSAPSLGEGPSGLPTIAVQGPNNSLFVYWEASNAQWYGPLGVGTWGTTDGAPSLGEGPSGLPTIAVQGPGNALWVFWEADNAQWYGPYGPGGPGSTFAMPSLSVSPSGLPTVVVEGPSAQTWAYWEADNAQWYGPLGVGGPGSANSAPSIAIGANDLPVVAVEGPVNSLWIFWEADNAQWYGPLGVGAQGSTNAAPSIAAGQ